MQRSSIHIGEKVIYMRSLRLYHFEAEPNRSTAMKDEKLEIWLRRASTGRKLAIICMKLDSGIWDARDATRNSKLLIWSSPGVLSFFGGPILP